MEKASKRIEADKTIAKVASGPSKSQPLGRKRKFVTDKSDLRPFLDKGASAKYGGRKDRRQQPYNSYTRFQSNKYYQGHGHGATGSARQSAPKGSATKES